VDTLKIKTLLVRKRVLKEPPGQLISVCLSVCPRGFFVLMWPLERCDCSLKRGSDYSVICGV